MAEEFDEEEDFLDESDVEDGEDMSGATYLEGTEDSGFER